MRYNKSVHQMLMHTRCSCDAFTCFVCIRNIARILAYKFVSLALYESNWLHAHYPTPVTLNRLHTFIRNGNYLECVYTANMPTPTQNIVYTESMFAIPVLPLKASIIASYFLTRTIHSIEFSVVECMLQFSMVYK